MQRVVLVLFFVMCHSLLFSQEAPTPQAQNPAKAMFSFAPEFGFIAVHTKQMEHLVQGHSYGFAAQFLFPSGTEREWEKAYNFPERGIDFYFNNSGNLEQLGYQVGTTYFLNLPLNHRKNLMMSGTYRHWLGLGLGLGYSTKSWNLEYNHQAAALGSKLNICLVLQYGTLIATVGQSQIRGGLRITHFSNGAFQTPNLGINNVAFYLGYIPRFLDNRDYKVPTETPGFDKKERVMQSVSFAMGMRETSPPLGDKYLTYTLNYLFDYGISYKISFAAGADLFYNTSVLALMERRDDVEYNSAEAIQAGLLVGTGIRFGKFQLRIQQGFYVRDNWGENGNLYHRFGLRYQFHKHWNCCMMLKTHFAKADHGEFGIGYSF